MIVLDTSALVAIALNEGECVAFRDAIDRSERALLSTVTAVETRIVLLARKGQSAVLLIDDYLREKRVELVAPGDEEMAAAYAAFVIYGKGRGHSANLNFGDLFGYALAKVRGAPLLFKGADFATTDIVSATAPAP